MNKEREIDDIKIVVNGEQYEAYKGTLQDEIKKQNKYIEMLQNNIEKLVEKNEELKSKLKATNKVLNDMDDIAGGYEERIDKAVDYIEETWKKESYYEDIENCVEFATINDIQKDRLLDILKGDNNV